MPKDISLALSQHLDQEVTTLCSCWRVVRKDGQTFYFTDHDQDVIFEGNVYEAESSYKRTAIENTTDIGVSNLDVSGILDTEKIREEELRAGLFNRADVYIFMVNYEDPDMGAIRIRRGWFGEVVLNEDGTFVTEIRGLAQALTHNWIETYSSECRADFCDDRCKLNIADYTNRATVTDRGNQRTTFTGSDIVPAPTIGTSVGAYRWWSFKPITIPNGVSFDVAQLRFRDQDGNLVTGGTAFDNIPRNLGAPQPNRAIDGKYHTFWGFDTALNDADPDDTDMPLEDVRWWIDFGTEVDIAQVELIIGDPAKAVSAWDLQYTNAEPTPSTVWDTAANFNHLFTQEGESALFALGAPAGAPISVQPTPIDMPPPVTGASTYVGGTITWVTGRNAGRTVEIIGFDEATQTVTMFDRMPYAIVVGDMFDIAQGCDRSLAACKLYNNVINRRAEDYVPGNDEFMRYPDAPN